jgi:hypothetical protein
VRHLTIVPRGSAGTDRRRDRSGSCRMA